MTHKLQVEEHLRNGALYTAGHEPSLSGEWKRKLLNKYILQQQLKAALGERPHKFRLFVYIGIPILAVALALAIFFGYINPENMLQYTATITNFETPAIGLKEALIFVGIMNIWTLFALRKRFSSF